MNKPILVSFFVWIFSALLSPYSAVALASDQPANAQASADRLHFSDPSQRQRYYQLIEEIRCPKCQNQNLADSDAPIAHDLRNELFMLIDEGYSNDDILKFMQDRYGEFVLYAPPVNRATAVLWLLPASLFVVGLLVLIFMLLKNRSKPSATGDSDLAAANQKIDALLDAQHNEQAKTVGPDSALDIALDTTSKGTQSDD